MVGLGAGGNYGMSMNPGMNAGLSPSVSPNISPGLGSAIPPNVNVNAINVGPLSEKSCGACSHGVGAVGIGPQWNAAVVILVLFILLVIISRYRV